MIEKHNPQQYVQYPAAVERCREWLDEDSLIVTGRRAWESFCGQLKMPETSIRPQFVQHASQREVRELVDLGRRSSSRRVLAIGGGRAIDVGKAAATLLNKPSVVVPTVFSTDAPCSSLSVLYDDNQQPAEYLDHKQNPQQVIVDTELLKQGPERYFRAGLVGGLSVFYEAEEIFAARRFRTANVMEGHALMSAQWAKQRLLRLCDQFCKSRPEQLPDKSLNDVYFVCFWMTADCFEHVGISLPHTVYRILRGMGLADVGGYLHGELVGLGLVCQTVLCPTHRIESVRIEQLVGQILGDVDWRGLTSIVKDQRESFVEQAGRWSINENISAPITVEALYNCVIEVSERLATYM